MPNHLVHENSPYLLQHAENPVDWYPWGAEALEKARQEDKPIFLSIGYAACHWCHVMAHESFEDPQTAQIMNEHFVNIKVDREERPDLDSIYMNAVVAMTGQGGWPMSVFLLPDGQPFFGGTYFPPVRRYNMPAFRDILQSIAHSWKTERERVLEAGQEMAEHLTNAQSIPRSQGELTADIVRQAAQQLGQSYDWKQGGWGKAPKFPQPMAIEFLLRRAVQGDRSALEIASHALTAMARGGMYDVVGGGFARYSTDERWLVPHFEKMLYDNAQLALAYLHAHLLTGDPFFRRITEETLDFMARELLDPAGGFYSSLDADSEGEEGKFYVWTEEEIRRVLADFSESEQALFFAAYSITARGNFEGRTVLQRSLMDKELAEKFSLPMEQVVESLRAFHAALLRERSLRVRPATDDKVLVAWNGLALRAFAEAARYLKRPDYKELALRNGDFLVGSLFLNDRLFRSWRAGQARHTAYLEDHAALCLGLLSLYQTDPDPYWFSTALSLAEAMLTYYADPQGGFFDTRDDQTDLIVRPKELQDNATPSGNSLAAQALLQLAAYTGEGKFRDQAESMLREIYPVAARYPTAFSNWLCALDAALSPALEVALLGQPEAPDFLALIDTVWRSYRPHLVLAASAFPPPPNSPALLLDRPLLNHRATAYVCQGFVCRQPVTNPDDLQAQLVSQSSTKETGQ